MKMFFCFLLEMSANKRPLSPEIEEDSELADGSVTVAKRRLLTVADYNEEGEISYMLHSSRAKAPTRATDNAAGVDIYSAEVLYIKDLFNNDKI